MNRSPVDAMLPQPPGPPFTTPLPPPPVFGPSGPLPSLARPSLPLTIRFFPAERRAVAPRKHNPDGSPLRTSDWTRRFRRVIRGKKAAPWSDDLAPYAPWIMDLSNLPWVREIYLCWAPRTCKTNLALSCITSRADLDPGTALYVMPVEELARNMMKNRIRPTFAATPHLAALLSTTNYEMSNILLTLQNGAQIRVGWATSEAMLSSEDERDVYIDECDKEQYSPGRGPNPILLAKVRSGNYPHTRKIMIISSPSEDPSNIWTALKVECDVVYALEARCPVCGMYQIMDLAHITWPEGINDYRLIRRQKQAWYVCDRCTMKWDDHTRDIAVRNARWVPGRINERDEWEPADPPDRPIAVGSILPSWYSPDVSLSEVAACAIRAKDDIEQEIELVTRYCARPYKKEIQTQTEVDILKRCTTLPSGIVPAGALVLTAGIDVQKIGFWFVIRAWMEDLSNHKIQHGFVSTFEDLEKILFETRWPVENSPLMMSIWRAAMDTGGSETESIIWTRTEEIYDWLHRNGRGMIFGTKGASRTQLTRVKVSRIETMPHSRLPIPGGLDLRILDTDALKKLLHWRFTIPAGEKQGFWLDADTDLEYARQLLAERLVPHRNGRREWIAKGPNHLLDCEVLAAACADRQWQPSLTMLAPMIKEQLARAEARAIADRAIRTAAVKPTSESSPGHPATPPAPSQPMLAYERPDWLNR